MWASGPVWTGAENLAPTGIRSPDRAARSESLYRLSYRGPTSYNIMFYVSGITHFFQFLQLLIHIGRSVAK